MDLRSLPSVDTLSRSPELEGYPERVRVEAAREAIETARSLLKTGKDLHATPQEMAATAADQMMAWSLGTAINLSGVILHTGLGRARLARAAVDQISSVAQSHSSLELDLEEGKRGNRQEHVRDLLRKLTGAEDAHVVNNAAGALLLCLAAFARDREVILSRGQMVEIGGSFRVPEIVEASGCRLVEVGCTNKTHLRDYEAALSDKTGAILRCHTSNYRIEGFAGVPELADLASLAKKAGVVCIDDMGTGCLVELDQFGLERIPTMQDSLNAGPDLVIGSGDKLLGGPQAGLILGSSKAVEKVRRHPLARAVRIDKLGLAGLEATLRLYVSGQERQIPTINYLTRSLDEVRVLAVKLASSLRNSTIAEGVTEIGGGSAPGAVVKTWRVGLSSESADRLARSLRQAKPPIIARIENGLVWLDPRTLDEEEVDTVCEVLRSL